MSFNKSIFGYRGENDNLFLKIYTQLPSHIASARRHLERGISLPSLGEIAFNPTFESNIQYTLRFMIDQEVVLVLYSCLDCGM